MASETYEIVGPVVFLGVVFLLVVTLIIVYKTIVGQSCSCLSDPGGREEARKERKQKKGYEKVQDDVSSSDDEAYVPPTMTLENEEGQLAEGELVGPETLSAYSAYSAYGDTISLDQSYLTDRGLGRLRFDVHYTAAQSHLKIHIIEGDDLPSKEQGGALNFKIHLTLLPKKQQRFKSKTQSRYSPRFNETFEFKDVLKEDLFTTAVRFRLYGVAGTGKLVGETFFQLADIAKMENPVIKGTWRAFRTIKTKVKK